MEIPYLFILATLTDVYKKKMLVSQPPFMH